MGTESRLQTSGGKEGPHPRKGRGGEVQFEFLMIKIHFFLTCAFTCCTDATFNQMQRHFLVIEHGRNESNNNQIMETLFPVNRSEVRVTDCDDLSQAL